MAEFSKINLQIEHRFDTQTKRHFLNGVQTVYHCHHYTTLYTQIAIDAGETTLLMETAEDAFYPIFKDLFARNAATDLAHRVELARQYYSAIGLGVLEIGFLGNDSAQIVSPHSHLEQGWIKKWGKYDKAVNYIGAGYVSAMLAAVLNQPLRSFVTSEVSSIVMGDEKTIFKSYKK